MVQPLQVAIIPMQVKEDCIEQYKQVASENAECSRQEPGVVMFDVLQDQKDPTRFVLNEIYKSPADQQAHRETAHFKRFKERVTPLLVEPYVPAMYYFISTDFEPAK